MWGRKERSDASSQLLLVRVGGVIPLFRFGGAITFSTATCLRRSPRAGAEAVDHGHGVRGHPAILKRLVHLTRLNSAAPTGAEQSGPK